ncbi:unnamed protein product [Musa hybrid cultivar]
MGALEGYIIHSSPISLRCPSHSFVRGLVRGRRGVGSSSAFLQVLAAIFLPPRIASCQRSARKITHAKRVGLDAAHASAGWPSASDQIAKSVKTQTPSSSLAALRSDRRPLPALLLPVDDGRPAVPLLSRTNSCQSSWTLDF